MKTTLKFAAMVFAVTFAFIVVAAVVPYSEGLISAQQEAGGSALLFLLLNNTWLCLAICYVVVKSSWENGQLSISLMLMLVLILSFMMQIEILYFHSAFPILTYGDILWIFIANAVPVITGVPLALYMFRRENVQQSRGRGISLPGAGTLAMKLGLIGLAYVFVYFIFGYFVAWQTEELRVFYTGSAEETGFFAQLMDNLEENPSIYPFQFLRGVLFGVFILPLVLMFKENTKTMFISMLLVFMSTVPPLTIPNELFPDSVRWTHFWEMLTSMFVFSIIVWYIYAKWNRKT